VTPAERLSTVDTLLAGGAGAGGGTAPGPADASAVGGAAESARTVHTRAAAFLLRRTLDDRVNAYVQAHRPALLRCATRTKTAWLAQHAGPALAGRYAAAWHSLSMACHYHCSVLPPTTTELRGWRDDVAAVLRELQQSPTR
jgi:hypothetical protein